MTKSFNTRTQMPDVYDERMSTPGTENAFLLSIIIPVYNSEKHLNECLDSIISAGIPDFEIILVNDGSTDGSAALCREYARKYPFVQISAQENEGPSAARNNGFRRASGRYVTFFDSDDCVSPPLLREAAEFLRGSDADMWAFNFQRIAENGCVLDKVYQITQTEKPIESPEYLTEFLKAKDCFWNVWRYMFRRDFLIKNDLRFIEGVNYAEDMEFTVRAFMSAERISFSHTPYYFYKVDCGSPMRRRAGEQCARELMDMLELSHDLLKNTDAEYAALIDKKLSREYFLNLTLYSEAPKAERKNILKYLKAARRLLDGSPSAAYRILGKVISVFGVRNTAWILLMMKKLKRGCRAARVRRSSAGSTALRQSDNKAGR